MASHDHSSTPSQKPMCSKSPSSNYLEILHMPAKDNEMYTSDRKGNITNLGFDI